jgi:glycosyltransferase involved in cell wall biosynthesis
VTQASQPLVSCIVPVFNGERYLREALDSLFAQTYRPIEVIVVDDGSTDGTPAVVAAYADRVRAFQQANAGPAAARNRGVREARGDLIAFLDADDLWHASKAGRQVACLEARPDRGACVTHVQNFWISELQEEAARFRDSRLTQPLPAYLALALMARREVFEAVGEFDTTLGFGHSTDWFLRAAARGVLVEELREVLYYRRIHHTNRSRQLGQASRDEFLHLVKAHLDRQRQKGNSATAGGDSTQRRDGERKS